MAQPQSMEALSRLGEDQFKKFIEQGGNPNLIQQQFRVNMTSPPQQQRPSNQNPSQNSQHR